MTHQRYRISTALFVTVFLIAACFLYKNSEIEKYARLSSGSKCVKSHEHENSAKKIAIVTMSTEQTSYMHLSLANKFAYARQHGYDLHVDLESPPPNQDRAVWHKLTMIENLVMGGKHDWIWWIDFDALVTNTSIKLEDIIGDSLLGHPKPEDVDLLISADCNPINAGSMVFRASPQTLSFLTRVVSCGVKNPEISEQDCIQQTLEKNVHREMNRTVFVPQWKINAYPKEIGCRDRYDKEWEEGMFVVHFPGAWAYLKGEDAKGGLMRKYAEFINA